MREFHFSKPIFFCALVWGLALSFCGVGNALDLNLLLPIDQVDYSGSPHHALYDMALTDGAAHVVYTKSGNVYYAVATEGNPTWNITNLGPGSWPTIASDANNNVMIAFANGNTIYGVGTSIGWTPTPIMSGVSGGKPILSSPFFVTGWQMVVEGNYDGDRYAEILRLVNSGSGWGNPEILKDGWYYCGWGGYFSQSSIAAFADGSYSLAYQHDNCQGSASYSRRYAIVEGPGTARGEIGGLPWNGTTIQISRRAVSAISEDGSPHAIFACAVNNGLYVAINEGTGWNWLLQNYGSGHAPSVSWTGAVYADLSGNLHFVTRDGQNNVIDEQITYQGNQLSGTAPLIWSMEDKFFLFRDGDGILQFGTTALVPEPASVVSLLTGTLGMLFTVGYRRRK